MLSSSIMAPAELFSATAQDGAARIDAPRATTAHTVLHQQQYIARGPLARQLLRVIGIGDAADAWSAVARGNLERSFGEPGQSHGAFQAWVGGRVLPTPAGYVRDAVLQPSLSTLQLNSQSPQRAEIPRSALLVRWSTPRQRARR